MTQEDRPTDSEANSENIDIEALKKMLAEEQEKSLKYLSNWQRSQADLVNYKKYIDLDKQESSKFANSTLIVKLLPVIDDFERAISSLPPDTASQPWVEGFRLIDRKFRSILDMQGVTEIKAKGQPFDPRFHEAVRQDKGPEGVVLDEVEKGYMFKDRLLRASKVVVGTGEE